jgi:hypothetical protein
MDRSALALVEIITARAIEILDGAAKENELSPQLMVIVAEKIMARYQRAAITSLYATQTMLVDKINQTEETGNGNTDNTNKPDTGNDDTAGEYQPV